MSSDFVLCAYDLGDGGLILPFSALSTTPNALLLE